MCGLEGAVGDRVSLLLTNGARVRVALPFGVVGSLPGQALEALQVVLPADTHHALYSKYLVQSGVYLQDILTTASMFELSVAVICK